MRLSVFKDAVLLACVWYFIYSSPAQAYFDLNATSYMLQLFLGFGAAFWFSFKGSLKRIFFKEKTKSKTEDVVLNDSEEQSESVEANKNT